LPENFVSPPMRKPAINTTAAELLNGVQNFLAHEGITVGRMTDAPSAEGEPSTEITFLDVSGDRAFWREHRYIFFDVRPRFSSMKAKLGDGPFPLTIMASRLMEEADAPCRTLFKLVARPNKDRSISFSALSGL
jgi:hypothetical protein